MVANLGDAGARAVASGHAQATWYGLDAGADLRCIGWGHANGRLAASLSWRGSVFTVEAPLVGRHNLDNVLATCTCALLAGLDPGAIDAALRSFPGVRRRLEVLGEAGGVVVVDDFAHHPTAVRLTLEGARHRFPGRRVVAVFEPRSLTAGRAVFAEAYVAALGNADLAILAPPYHRARLSRPGAPGALDVPALVDRLAGEGREAFSAPDPSSLAEALLPRLADGDVVIVMSSGAFGGLCGRLVQGSVTREALSA